MHTSSVQQVNAAHLIRASRKPQTIERKRVAIPVKARRERIALEFCELAVSGESREISAVLASRHGVSERMVDRIIGITCEALMRSNATFRTCVTNALSQAHEVEAETWQEVAQ
jgi:hypothetical protein